ncbi:MAG: B12-binding domain-containing radical SAM protein [Anaerohalosphaeraceae bacterium]|nr:B12-binding domain-containing radical SAM protein [Anaerohalosphaeraceae bacterium]
MRVLLVKPPSNTHFVMPPIGLGYIASYLKKKVEDIEVHFLDCLRDGINHQKFADHIRELKPDVVGITAFSVEVDSAIRCCQVAKSVASKIVTVIGGPHATFMPEEILSNEQVDFIFRNEAEIAFAEFIEELKDSRRFERVSNIGYKVDGRIQLNPVQLPQELDDLPFPDYEFMGLYPKTYKMKHYPSAPILTSRGCPFPCTYCSGGKLSGKKVRSRSPQNIINEIKLLKKNNNIKEFEIWDDNFTLNRKRTDDFCDFLLKEKINLPWWCPNGLRVETLDEPLIKKMKEAGLYAIAIGVESGSEKIQKDMKKNLDFEKVREVVTLGNKYRIRMEGFFILGYPTETREDILKTIKMSKGLPLKRASILLFQPLIGSEIYDTLKKEGRLEGLDMHNAEYSNPTILPQGFNDLAELKKLHKRAILEFYLRPKVLPGFILENLSRDQLKHIWAMIKKYLFSR